MNISRLSKALKFRSFKPSARVWQAFSIKSLHITRVASAVIFLPIPETFITEFTRTYTNLTSNKTVSSAVADLVVI